MSETYQEFKEFVNRPGAKSMIKYEWMAQGCPFCGCKTWSVTCDYWAYCKDCGAGFPTDYPMTATGKVLSTIEFDENGVGKYAEDTDAN